MRYCDMSLASSFFVVVVVSGTGEQLIITVEITI